MCSCLVIYVDMSADLYVMWNILRALNKKNIMEKATISINNLNVCKCSFECVYLKSKVVLVDWVFKYQEKKLYNQLFSVKCLFQIWTGGSVKMYTGVVFNYFE